MQISGMQRLRCIPALVLYSLFQSLLFLFDSMREAQLALVRSHALHQIGQYLIRSLGCPLQKAHGVAGAIVLWVRV